VAPLLLTLRFKQLKNGPEKQIVLTAPDPGHYACGATMSAFKVESILKAAAAQL
jgi:hypothetical protein